MGWTLCIVHSVGLANVYNDVFPSLHRMISHRIVSLANCPVFFPFIFFSPRASGNHWYFCCPHSFVLFQNVISEKAMAFSSTLAWKIPWMEEPGRLQSVRSLRVGHDWATERLHFSLSCIGEGNGNPLQCCCLENPRDGGAWWAAVCGVAQSRTLKRLSSRMLRSWRRTICDRFRSSTFPQQHEFTVPLCLVLTCSRLFYGCIVLHCVDVPQLIYPVTCWRISWLLSWMQLLVWISVFSYFGLVPRGVKFMNWW